MKCGLIISAWWAATPDRNVTQRTRAAYLCRSAPFPLCPARFAGCSGSAPWGGGGVHGRGRFQRCWRLTNWNESGETFRKHPVSGVFYLWDWLMKQNGHVCRFFACSEMAKGWRGKTESEKIEKRPFPSPVAAFPVSVTAANQNPNFYGACLLASFHLFPFILFAVAHLWKHKAKACDSCWELNCHKLPLLTGWWIAFISASPLI